MKTISKKLILLLTILCLVITGITCNKQTTDAAAVFKTRTITITKSSRQVVDKLNGVKAYYRRGGNDGSDKFYSCAAFVKRYYKEVYGKKVDNLFYNRTPNVYGDTFIRVSKPQVGDIVGMNTSHSSTHWAIVKKVHKNGTVTLIEQNWKWIQSSQTKSVVNRKISVKSGRFYRLKSEDKIYVSLFVE